MKKTLFILLVIFLTCPNILAQTKDIKAGRTKLEGFWAYKDAPLSCIFREANRAGEKLGEVDVLVQYDIRWKEGLDHDLIVTKVIPGENTPPALITALYKVGDVLQVTVLEITDQYYKYNLKYKKIEQKGQYLYRVPKEQYESWY